MLVTLTLTLLFHRSVVHNSVKPCRGLIRPVVKMTEIILCRNEATEGEISKLKQDTKLKLSNASSSIAEVKLEVLVTNKLTINYHNPALIQSRLKK